jgi:CSLREA domain-containing protein
MKTIAVILICFLAIFILLLPTQPVQAFLINPTPAVDIVVNTLEDELNSDGDCSIREAVTAANTNSPTDACPAGSAVSEDRISFSPEG